MSLLSTARCVSSVFVISCLYRSTTPEEMQGKYDRMVATSLLAVSYLLQHLPTDKKAGVHSQIDALFVQPKLWKYSKSKVPSVYHTMVAIKLMCILNCGCLGSCGCL